MTAFWIGILSFCIGWYIGAGVQSWLERKGGAHEEGSAK